MSHFGQLCCITGAQGFDNNSETMSQVVNLGSPDTPRVGPILNFWSR